MTKTSTFTLHIQDGVSDSQFADVNLQFCNLSSKFDSEAASGGRPACSRALPRSSSYFAMKRFEFRADSISASKGPKLVYDRNSLRTYYCLFLSVILVSVATEN